MRLDLSGLDRTLANYLCETPMHHSVPIYFGNPLNRDSKVNNGTATLVKKNNLLYAVTNHHVLSEYLDRKNKDNGVTLQIGGLIVQNISERIRFDDKDIDICVLDFPDHQESDFRMGGDVPTKFYELGENFIKEITGTVVAFGGYPGSFRARGSDNHVSFRTVSSGCSVIEDKSDRAILVSINHDKDAITLLGDKPPPEDIAGMSGGPVFEIARVSNLTTLRLVGVIYECSNDFKVLFARPLSSFASAFSYS
jgi:hypothetical protein